LRRFIHFCIHDVSNSANVFPEFVLSAITISHSFIPSYRRATSQENTRLRGGIGGDGEGVFYFDAASV
jgi:hypothetical protein